MAALNLSLHPVPNDHHRRWVGETQDSSIIPDGAAGCLVFWPKSFTLENKTGCIPNNFIMNRVEYQFLNIRCKFFIYIIQMFMELLELNKIEAKILYWKMPHRKLIDLTSYILIEYLKYLLLQTKCTFKIPKPFWKEKSKIIIITICRSKSVYRKRMD